MTPNALNEAALPEGERQVKAINFKIVKMAENAARKHLEFYRQMMRIKKESK